jgi:hypothetical protein
MAERGHRVTIPHRGYCERLELTHFIDEHPEVHAAIRGTVDYEYYFGPEARPVPEQPSTPSPGTSWNAASPAQSPAA